MKAAGPAGVAGPGSGVESTARRASLARGHGSGVGRRPAQGLRGLGGSAEAEGRTAAGPAQLRAASKRARRLRSQRRSPMSCVTVTRGVITASPVGAHDSSRGCAGAFQWAGQRSGAGVGTGAGDGGHPTPCLSAFRFSWGAARTSDVPFCPRKCKHARCHLAGMGGVSWPVCWAFAVHACSGGAREARRWSMSSACPPGASRRPDIVRGEGAVQGRSMRSACLPTAGASGRRAWRRLRGNAHFR